ncbi:MAG: glycosyltransferase, partial [Desulfovibrio sp.]|nr:glycosyltransferase [Desulfovibrio sp.]
MPRESNTWNMRICVLCTTRDRPAYLERLLESLSAQEYRDFYLLLGDQNPPHTLDSLLARYEGKFSIQRVVFEPCGLSEARNKLLPLVQGDLFTPADDDCYYAPASFAQAVRYADTLSADAGGFVGMGFPSVRETDGVWHSPTKITRYTVFSKAPSWCIFLRCAVIRALGGFDPALGIGAPTPWQSGEDTDYLLRLMNAGYAIYRADSLHVFHDAQSLSMPDLPKIKAYGVGRMRLLRKHGFPLWFKLANLAYPLFKMLHEFPRLGRSALKMRLAMFYGRTQGFFCRNQVMKPEYDHCKDRNLCSCTEDTPDKNRPAFSVCIPAYNDLPALIRCLRSVLAQDSCALECIVSDDSVTDDIETYCRQQQDPRIRYIRNSPSLGAPKNWNAALALAKGDIVTLLHQDDWYLAPDTLTLVQKAMQTNAADVLVTGRSIY